MVSKNSPVFIACRPTGIIAILLWFCIMIMLSGNASADYEIAGTVEYQSSISNGYTLPSGSGNYATDVLYGNVSHRFTDAKEIYVIEMSGNIYYTDTAFSRASAFTATVDDVYYGAGVASIHNSNGDPVYKIVFDSVDSDYAKTLTGVKSVILDINNISKFNGISLTDYNRHSSAALSSSSTTSVRCLITGGAEGNFAADYVTSYNTYYYNNYIYTYTESTNYFLLNVDKLGYTSQLSVLNSTGGVYTQDDAYTTTPLEVYSNFNNGVILSSKFDVYGGVYVNTTMQADGDDYDFEYNITTELDEYSPGDTVNVTYTTDQKGTIQVVKTISGDIYHSIGFVSGATNATWDFYIAENEPYGFYDVYLLDSSNSILDSVRYSLLPTTSSLDILQSSVDLHETFVVFAQTVNESILSIEDPDGVEVWNESIGALMYDYIYYTPTIKTGIYTAYLYDDATLNDTVMVYLADPPIIDDPLDPVTNGTIPIEDVLEDDESMTEYFDDKFRGFAPTAWGIFLLSIILWLMAILTSFGGSGKRR